MDYGDFHLFALSGLLCSNLVRARLPAWWKARTSERALFNWNGQSDMQTYYIDKPKYFYCTKDFAEHHCLLVANSFLLITRMLLQGTQEDDHGNGRSSEQNARHSEPQGHQRDTGGESSLMALCGPETFVLYLLWCHETQVTL